MALEGDLAVLILDLELLREQEHTQANGTDPHSLLVQVLAFANAYTMMHKQNCLAVFAGAQGACHLLHLSQDADSDDASVFPSIALHSKLQDLMQRIDNAAAPTAGAPTATTAATAPTFPLSGALSRALCLIHRLQSSPAAAAAKRRPRIITLAACADAPRQYIPVMNAIFSAQRAGVKLDALLLAPPGEPDSSFLQQAAHLTDGLYFRPAPGEPVLPYLLNYFAVDTHTRDMLDVAQVLGVDFRASCFCHKRIVDIGYVCSVCLSIFCAPARSCTTCGTSFAPQQQPAGRPPAAACGAAAAAGVAGGPSAQAGA